MDNDKKSKKDHKTDEKLLLKGEKFYFEHPKENIANGVTGTRHLIFKLN